MVARSESSSAERPHRVGFASPASRNYDAELEEQAQELDAARRYAAQLEQDRASDREWFAQGLRAARTQAKERATHRERVAQAQRVRESEQQRVATVEAVERLLMRRELAATLDSLTPRQIARMAPGELEDVLHLIYDED
jgi:arylamine N-acetyltransferase